MTDEISNRVLRVTNEHMGVDVKLTDSFTDDLNCDSLDSIELVMAFEEEFQIEILDDVAEKINTVQEAVDAIRGLVNTGK